MITEKELKCIKQTLLNYRMKNMFFEADDTENYLLVDLLSVDGTEISTGIDEIENIMESIFLDLQDVEMKELKLFIWTGFARDYTGGLAFAIAKNETEARAMVKSTQAYIGNWGELEIVPVNLSIARSVCGGG